MVGATVDRRTVIKAGAAAASAGLLPRSAFSATAPRKGGSLRVSMPYNPASVDPMTGRNLPDFNVLYAVFDALIDFEPSTPALKPGLAKSWSFSASSRSPMCSSATICALSPTSPIGWR